MDGFGETFGQNTGQLVLGWRPMNVVREFAIHLNSFLLNGISAITYNEVEYDICRTEGFLIYFFTLSVQYISSFVFHFIYLNNCMIWTDHFLQY